MNSREKKIDGVYNQLFTGIVIFALFSMFALISGRVLDRISSSLLLLLAIVGFVAFYIDKEQWRKRSAR